MPTPQMTPEMYQELMGQQANEGGMPQDPNQMTPEQMQMIQQQSAAMQQPQMMQQQQQQNPEVEIDEAKKLLGLDGYEEKMSEMQQKLQQMEAEKVAASMRAKYPDVPQELVEETIKKIEEVDPGMAANMRTTEVGLEMAYRAALADMKPKDSPDNLTDDGGGNGGAGGEDLETTVREGKANDFMLGDYILGLQK